jgi:hypothetical protein
VFQLICLEVEILCVEEIYGSAIVKSQSIWSSPRALRLSNGIWLRVNLKFASSVLKTLIDGSLVNPKP